MLLMKGYLSSFDKVVVANYMKNVEWKSDERTKYFSFHSFCFC